MICLGAMIGLIAAIPAVAWMWKRKDINEFH